MSVTPLQLADFTRESPQCVLVTVAETLGSTPREQGAWMLVSAEALLGTIGGGQLEYLAIDEARRALRVGGLDQSLDIPLGPEIGQCCGGRVQLELAFVGAECLARLNENVDQDFKDRPALLVFGAGHVGRALVRAVSLLPMRTILIDGRRAELNNLPANIEVRLSALPEAEVRAAPPNSSIVVVTHDHALDFLIVREALLRGDCAYVGMIGSRTKRASFKSWLKADGGNIDLIGGPTCPIGGEECSDKRPEIIAAMVVAEVLVQTNQERVGALKKIRPILVGLGDR